MVNQFPRVMNDLGLTAAFRSATTIYYCGLCGRWPVTAYEDCGTVKMLFYTDRLPDKTTIAAMKKEFPVKAKISNTKTCVFFILKEKDFLADSDNLLHTAVDMLDKYGLHPKDECPYCGRGGCDTVASAYVKRHVIRYNLTHRTCMQERARKTWEKATVNAESGSYLAGVIGSLLGMLVGCVPSVITGWFLNTIYVLLVALIPICSYFGYKLMGGKMNRTPLVLSVIMSVVGIYVMYSLTIISYWSMEYGVTMGEAAYIFLTSLGTDFTLLDITMDCRSYFAIAALSVWWLRQLIFHNPVINAFNAEGELKLARPWPPVISYGEKTEAIFEEIPE